MVERVIQLNDPIINTLKEIQTNDAFKDSKNTAGELLNTMIDRRAAFFLRFYMDIMTVLSPVSLKMQAENSFAAETVRLLTTAMQQLKNLGKFDEKYSGKAVMSFMQSCKCGQKKCESLETYFYAENVQCGELTMGPRSTRSRRNQQPASIDEVPCEELPASIIKKNRRQLY